jgi:hypothetical protein
MKVMTKLANALSFAHLAGVSARAEPDDKKDTGERDHEDTTSKKSKRAAEKEDEKQATTDKDNEHAEDKGDDEEMAGDDLPESDDGDEDDEGDKKGKKVKKARAEDKKDEEDEEDDDRNTEMSGRSPLAQARLRERSRCAAIFSSRAAAKNPVLAANLAFKTNLSRAAAIDVLEGTPVGAPAHMGRAARNPNVGSGAAGSVTSQQAVSASWDRAFATATGARPR